MKQELAARGGGIDAFGVTDEINPEGAELFQTIDQVLDRAGETIELPYQHHVEPALVNVL